MELIFIGDREAYDQASALIEQFGPGAIGEARQRAARSRDWGNFIHYTRWCRVGRTIRMLETAAPSGTVH
ncbi:hypothetical protein [Sphingomonas morindae]|uniref:Uncharacterized protein n=1 Tax=Sphingomonas morindae TaxID=1541170 RepID=A0ABY4XA91_9SPHN|nr:hypothetical protein [Sphingomonas morindae]USI73838.1 hypothetical protein LHA26_05055 [Sphingomonas morindae]